MGRLAVILQAVLCGDIFDHTEIHKVLNLYPTKINKRKHIYKGL